MRLIKQTVTRLMQNYDEGRMNKEFPVHTFYQSIQICAMVLGVQLENDKYINTLYQSYYTARKKGDMNKVMHYISLLKAEMIKDKVYFDRFEEKYRNIDVEDDSMTEFYNKDAVGFLAHLEQ